MPECWFQSTVNSPNLQFPGSASTAPRLEDAVMEAAAPQGKDTGLRNSIWPLLHCQANNSQPCSHTAQGRGYGLPMRKEYLLRELLGGLPALAGLGVQSRQV